MPYIKEVFYPSSLEHAKHIALTSDPNKPNKFYEETQSVINMFRPSAYISNSSRVLDFGCGMGRMSKAIIEEYNCNVIGVDTSPGMRKYAVEYVNNPEKFTCLESYNEPESIDIAFCFFVLQHVQFPQKEIDSISSVIVENGYLALLNEPIRFVPSGVDKDNYVIWEDDKFNIEAALFEKFRLIESRSYMNHPTIKLQLFQKKNAPRNFNYSTNTL
jgi:SAM-dependent methyltransferase